MRLRLVREPFDHPNYIFELKHDGCRAIAYLQNGECKLVSRNQRNLGFEALKRSLAKLPVENAILDGEIICVDAKGVSQFNQLLSRKGEPVFYAFDLLWLDGEDLREMPLVERKKRLARLVWAAKCPRLLYAQHIEQHGKAFFVENLRP
jgi:bifunctional non-homologous end joining protein LigD